MKDQDRDRIIELSKLGLHAPTIAYVMNPSVTVEQVRQVIKEELDKRAKGPTNSSAPTRKRRK